MNTLAVHITSAAAMEELGAQLGKNCPAGTRIYLQGELGAGKTTLVRGFLRARSYTGKVRSPTYTLVEAYELQDVTIYHFDLYRLTGPEELEGIGFRDYLDGGSLLLLEWPEKAGPLLEAPDLLVSMVLDGDKRRLCLRANSARGQEILLAIQ